MKRVENAEILWQASTPLNTQFNDPYFSLVNGLEETEYVFLKHNNLPDAWRNKQHFVIGETGFGTGLNFLVTAQAWMETENIDSHLTFYSVEKYPLNRAELARSFESWPQFASISNQLLHQYPDALPGFHSLFFQNERITLVLMIGDVIPMLENMQSRVDCWYLDGFSPAKNPEMWSEEVCQCIANHSHKETSFATFTAAGLVRRNLQHAGFEVKKTPGFGKKREMLSGKFALQSVEKISKTPWFNLSNMTDKPSNEVVIIGGGVAGLSCAWMLSLQNIPCTIIEAGGCLASGASGNAAGIVMPRFSLDMNLESQFYISSFLFAVSCLNLLKQDYEELVWQQSGVLQLASQERINKIAALDLPTNFLQRLTQQQATAKAGLDLNREAILYPGAGYVNPQQLCVVLATSNKRHIKIKTHTEIESISREGEGDNWQFFDKQNNLICENKTVIFANGFDAQRLLGMDTFALSKSRGQLSYIATQDKLKNLQMPVCDEAYILPQINGEHVIGASYSLDEQSTILSMQDHEFNLHNVEKILARKLQIDSDQLAGRVSFRTTSLDHLPLVGAVPDEIAYLSDYVNLHHGRKAESYPQAKYLPNLYLSTGHGSRGLVSCFASAAYLTSLISGKPITLAENSSHLLHPARFLLRSLKKRPAKH